MNQIKQGYKQTKVGIIPEDWEVVRLGDICIFYKGKGISKENLSEEGIPCIRYGELYTTYNEKIDNVISKTNVDVKELFLSKSNDIIIPASGETAIDIATASCVLHDNIALSGDLNVIRTKENGIFLSYYLNVVAKHRIASIAQGVSVVHLYSSQLENLFLSLPPLKEQEKIAEILTTWDEAITKQTELLEAKELLKKALMQKLLSGEVRFSGFSGEWKETKIGLICTIKTSTSKSEFKSDDGTFFIVDMGSVSKDGELIVTKKTNIQKDMLNKDDLIMSKDDIGGGQIIGRTARIDCDNKYVMGDHVFLLQCKKDNPIFIHYLINSHSINKSFRRKSTGTAQLGLNKKSVETQMIICPDIKEQQKIAEVLSLADEEINLLKSELKELKLQKKALMQKLLTGEVRVKV
ncbi:MAG: restriction endonuclease subunit S [Campylobacterales bacterium]|nr:restriction endonuclease subunit S [Campylobacterales bacterium]